MFSAYYFMLFYKDVSPAVELGCVLGEFVIYIILNEIFGRDSATRDYLTWRRLERERKAAKARQILPPDHYDKYK